MIKFFKENWFLSLTVIACVGCGVKQFSLISVGPTFLLCLAMVSMYISGKVSRKLGSQAVVGLFGFLSVICIFSSVVATIVFISSPAVDLLVSAIDVAFILYFFKLIIQAKMNNKKKLKGKKK